MAIALFILILLAVWHFIYDGILLPSRRLNLRYKLFALRDKLRNLELAHKKDIPTEVFINLDNSINVTINYLPYFTLSSVLVSQKEYKSNAGLRKEIDARIAIINSCKNNDVKSILDENTQLAGRALFLNMGGWLVYLIPILIIVFILRKINLFALDINSKVSKISFTPEGEISRITHSYDTV